MNGKVIVFGFIVLVAIIGIVLFVFKPLPPSAIEVAMAKQRELLGTDELLANAARLKSLPRAEVDSFINYINYALRIEDSIQAQIPDSYHQPVDSLSDAEIDAGLQLDHFLQRALAARARLLQILGHSRPAIIDSFFTLAHQAPLHYPQDSLAILERISTLERYQAQIFE